MVAITTKKLLTPMIIQSETASTNGLNPTAFTVLRERLAPIRNNVRTRPFFARYTNVPVNADGRLQ